MRIRKNRRIKQKTFNQIARDSLYSAGYEIVAQGSGQIPNDTIDPRMLYEVNADILDARSNLFEAVRRLQIKGYKDIRYTVGAGLRYASQGYNYFIGGKK